MSLFTVMSVDCAQAKSQTAISVPLDRNLPANSVLILSFFQMMANRVIAQQQVSIMMSIQNHA